MDGNRAPNELATFYAEQYDRVRTTMVLLVRDRALADELTQDAFVRVCERWSKVREMAAPGAWVHRVAVNLALSKHRRRKAEKRALVRLGPVADRVEQPVRDPELVDAVAGLPDDERVVVVLRFAADWSVDQVADALGLATGTVKTRTRRGLQRLREAGIDAPDPDESTAAAEPSTEAAAAPHLAAPAGRPASDPTREMTP